MERATHPNSKLRPVEEVFVNFKSRRAAIIKALTTELDVFFQQCDPSKDNLSLFGDSNGNWEVNLPVEEVPPEMPEPVLGINFARDGMQLNEWLSMIAVHSDSWLLAVAFFFATQFGYGKNERDKLFRMINELPTVFEVVTGKAKQPKQVSIIHNSGSKSNYIGKSGQSELQQSRGIKMSSGPQAEDEEDSEEEEDEEEEEEEDQGATCGVCGNNNGIDEFWICCDVCEVWFHGKCVKVTPAKAEHIKQYKCPRCISCKKPRF